MQRGRPPLPVADKRVKMSIRVRPSFKSQFVAAAEQRGLTPAAAHREAMKNWVTNVSPTSEEA
jgi:hypothetical protein